MVLHWQAFLHLYCVWFCGMFLVSIVLGWYYKSSFHEAWLYYFLLHQQLTRLNLHKLFCFSFKFLVYSVSYSTSVELSLLTTDQRTTSTPQQAEPKLTATPFFSPDDCWLSVVNPFCKPAAITRWCSSTKFFPSSKSIKLHALCEKCILQRFGTNPLKFQGKRSHPFLCIPIFSNFKQLLIIKKAP